MPGALLPLFPLNVVLFPNHLLPLHIFEERYKEMIGEAIQQKSEFGIVLAAESGIVNVGCTAVVEKVVEEYPDGRMDIMSRGKRRFEILSLNEDKAYLRGAVEFFDDEEDADPPSTALMERALGGYRELTALEERDRPELDARDPQLSFQLADAVPDVNFRQVLLVTRSEAERIRRLADFLPGYVTKTRRVTGFRAVARNNGHWKYPSGM